MFSVNALIVGEGVRHTDYNWGFFIALLVNTVVAFVIVAVQWAVSGALPSWQPISLVLFILAGVFATYLGRMLFFFTVLGMGPSRASAFQVTQPVFASVLAFGFLGQRLRAVEIGLMAVVLAGLFLVNRSRVATSTQTARAPAAEPAAAAMHHPGGRADGGLPGFAVRHRLLLAALASGLSYAAANVFRSAAINVWNEPFVGSLLGALAGVGCYLAFHIRARDVATRWRATDRRGLLLFSISGVLTILAQTATIASLRYLPVAIANVFAVSLPILVVPLSILVLRNREGITALTVIGVVVTWAGVVGIVVA